VEKEVWEQHSFFEDLSSEIKLDLRQKRLHEAIEPYIDVKKLRQLAQEKQQLEEALRTGDIPEELHWILSMMAIMLKPIEREQVKSPHDIAPHLQLRYGHDCQENFCVVCLNTKNRVQKVQSLYRGTVNTTHIRVAEIFREPIKLGSAAIITGHNHPSSDPTPSLEDVSIVRKINQAAEILEIGHLDHIIFSHATYVSLRELGLGFDK
jgi:DNA repair protein RadC